MLLLQLFHPENIYIALVGVEVWTSGDLISVDTSNKSNTLREFCFYRRTNISRYHYNDNAQLITYVSLLGSQFQGPSQKGQGRQACKLFMRWKWKYLL